MTAPAATRSVEETALTLVRRAQACATLEDLHYLLVNDLALLLPADRTALVTLGGGGLRLAAIGGQVAVTRRSPFVRELKGALSGLAGKKEICLAAREGRSRGLPPVALAPFQELLRREELGVMLYLPLVHQEVALGGLLLFYGRTPPPRVEEIRPLARIAPPLAAALERELLLRRSPAARRARARLRQDRPRPASRRRWLLAAVGVTALLLLPVPFKVGGQAQLEPSRFHICYSELTAPVAEVRVRQGQAVRKGELLARLDDRDLAYAVRQAARERARLETEIEILRNASAADLEKAWELDLALLRRDLAAEKERWLKGRREKLELRAPVTGLVTTRKVESLTGRRFQAGEGFCRLAPTEGLEVVVSVPESDAAYLAAGMPMQVRFAAAPDDPLELQVETVSPLAEPGPGRGNEVRVRAAYTGEGEVLKPGMGGVGHIRVGRRALGFVMFRRIWQRLRGVWDWL